MILPALLLAAAAPTEAAEPPSAGSLVLGGRTAAPSKTIAQAALQEAVGFAARSLKCGDVGGATASTMPKRWVPADPNFRIGPKGARYERWEIQACGRSERFLVVFWKDKKAGPQYQVGHPFPAEPAKP
ncbi:MAG TPA: hypothetical protein VGB04_00820 [Allosphingosinicella sp.]